VKQEGCGQDFVARWKEGFVEGRLGGLYARNRGKIVSEKIIGQEARILKRLSKHRPMARPIGAPESWLSIWAFRTVG
jgi:hypothetical protein